jgi:hypothetical protein
VNPPCNVCQYEGGFRIKPGGTLYPPAESAPPFTGKQWHSDDAGSRTGDCWEDVPMCAAHATQYTAVTWAAHVERSHARYRDPVAPKGPGPLAQCLTTPVPVRGPLVPAQIAPALDPVRGSSLDVPAPGEPERRSVPPMTEAEREAFDHGLPF